MRFIVQNGDDDGLQDFLISSLANGADLEVNVKKLGKSKSWEQLKGIYKLFQLALPHFQEWKPLVTWDIDKIKEFAKAELGYTRPPIGFEIAMMIKLMRDQPNNEEERQYAIKFCKKIKINRSFEFFTMTELCNFISEFEVWAMTPKNDKPAWSNVFLDDGDKRSLLGFAQAAFKV